MNKQIIYISEIAPGEFERLATNEPEPERVVLCEKCERVVDFSSDSCVGCGVRLFPF